MDNMEKRAISTKKIGIIAVILLVGVLLTGFLVIKDFGFFQKDEETLPEEISEGADQAADEEVEEVEDTVEEEVVEDLTLDVAAIDIKLINGGCDEINDTETNLTYKECDIDIEGTLKNTGTQDIKTRFVIHFLDMTSDNIIPIKIISIEEILTAGAEKILTTRYADVSPGEYIIRFKVDGGSNLDEVDEDNNARSDFIDVH